MINRLEPKLTEWLVEIRLQLRLQIGTAKIYEKAAERHGTYKPDMSPMDIGNRQGDRPFRNPSNSRHVALATSNEQSQDMEELESLDAAQVARCTTAVTAVAHKEREKRKDCSKLFRLI